MIVTAKATAFDRHLERHRMTILGLADCLSCSIGTAQALCHGKPVAAPTIARVLLVLGGRFERWFVCRDTAATS